MFVLRKGTWSLGMPLANTAAEKQLGRFYWIKSVENILWKDSMDCFSLVWPAESIFFDKVKDLMSQAYCIKKLQTKKSGFMWK